MVVTGLKGTASFSIGLGVKNSCGACGNIRITRVGLGLFKISWGKKLERYYHLWLACSFDGFAFVRTYVIHLLGTYVTILCNWLIL